MRQREESSRLTVSTFSLSLSCGSSKQPSWGQLRGWCLTSQAENGPCPFLPCSISFPSCLSFVMDTACNKKSQHIYGVADLAGTQVFYLPGTKQLCYSLTIHKPAQWWRQCFFVLKSGECSGTCTYCRLVYVYMHMPVWVCGFVWKQENKRNRNIFCLQEQCRIFSFETRTRL